jgi:hypothetical protein
MGIVFFSGTGGAVVVCVDRAAAHRFVDHVLSLRGFRRQQILELKQLPKFF